MATQYAERPSISAVTVEGEEFLEPQRQIERAQSLLAKMADPYRGMTDGLDELSVGVANSLLTTMAAQSGAADSIAPPALRTEPDASDVHPLSSLHAAELRYRALVDNIPAVTFIASLDGGRQDLYVSPQIQTLLGFTRLEWLADPFLWYNQVHPDDRERWGEALAQTCATGTPFKTEYRMLAREGRVVWIHGECKIIRDDANQPRFLQGIAFDITETKHAEQTLRRSRDELDARVQERTAELNDTNRALQSQIVERERGLRQIDHQYRELKRSGEALRESEGRLRAIVETAVDGIITLDEQGRIDSLNPAATRIFGYQPQEILGQNVGVLIPPPHADEPDGSQKQYGAGSLKKIIGQGREVVGQRKDGSRFPMELSVSATILGDRYIFTGMVRDITERKRFEEQLRQAKDAAVHAALHDRLTALPNRVLLQDRLTMAIERRRRNPKYNFALLFLDFDRFKLINDSLGHGVGDDLLIAIAKRLTGTLRNTDSIGPPDEPMSARIGGDEFVILAEDLHDARDAATVANRILKALAEPYLLRGHTITSTVSIGITTSDGGYERAEDMLRDADNAMYHAKAAGKAQYAIFDRKMHEEVITRMQLEGDLRSALERRELVLHYQPIVSLADRSLHGFESLIRWKHPQRGMVSPIDFIPCCEDTGLIIPIGYWVLDEACRQLRDWQDRLPEAAALTMSINISARQLLAHDLVTRVAQIISNHGVNPSSIILEITESAMIRDEEVAIPILKQLRALGVRLHMDDFGTGYSSLSCLHRFPLNGMKIDRSFIKSMSEQRDYAAIVQAITALARNLGMTLVAEGLETADQIAMLQAMDCDCGQGYFFSRPVPASAAEELVKRQTA